MSMINISLHGRPNPKQLSPSQGRYSADRMFIIQKLFRIHNE